MALPAVGRSSTGSGGLRRRGKKTIVVILAALVCLSSSTSSVVLCDHEAALPVPLPGRDERQDHKAADDVFRKMGFTVGDDDKNNSAEENLAFARDVGIGFVTSMTRKEFTVVDPDSVVAGAGTEDMLPKAVLGVEKGTSRGGLGVLRRVAGKSESAKSDFIRTVPVREPAGTILDFDESEYGSKCPARRYGIRGRVTEVDVEGKYLSVYYQQYDPSGHIFVDEEGSVTVKAENIIRAADGVEVVEKGTFIALLCRDYGEDVLLHVGWPNPFPVFRMDRNWSIGVKVTRITTTVAPSGKGTVVIAMLQRTSLIPSDIILDPDTQQPIKGVFMYVGRGGSWSKAYDVLAAGLEGQECTLKGNVGDLRPDLYCSLSSTNVPDSYLRAAGRARKAKIATSVVAAALGAIGSLLLLSKVPKPAKAASLLLFLGALGGAVGSKMRQDKLARLAALHLHPPAPNSDDEEHIIFIKADSYGPPTEEENDQRKVKLLLDYAREKQMEAEVEGRVNRRKQRRVIRNNQE